MSCSKLKHDKAELRVCQRRSRAAVVRKLWVTGGKSERSMNYIDTESQSYSLLYQLNDALCIHKEDFSLWLLVKSSSMAVKDVCNLETRGGKQFRHLIPVALMTPQLASRLPLCPKWDPNWLWNLCLNLQINIICDNTADFNFGM